MRIEEEVGRKLLERDNRSVRITRAGEIFWKYALDAIQNWDELMISIGEEGKQIKGNLSIYCSVTASYSILSDKLPMFREKYPGKSV